MRSNILKDEDLGDGWLKCHNLASGFYCYYVMYFAIKTQKVLSTLFTHRLLLSTKFSLQKRPFIQIDLEKVSRII